MKRLWELDSMIGHVNPGKPDGNRYALLAALVEAYEAVNYPIEVSDDSPFKSGIKTLR